jgi:folate-binding protein YgfZ
MSEVTEQLVAIKLALEGVHSLYGATFREEDGWRVPANYGDVDSEYRAIRDDGPGVIDLSARARIHVTGTEAAMFLNGLVTNDMKTLGENRWMPAVFPTVQGRIIAAVRIVRTHDGFLLDTEPVSRDRVLKTIERFTLAGDFRVSDLTETTAMLSVQGKAASQVVEKIVGDPLNLDHNGTREITWHDQSLTIVRATHTSENGFDLIVPTENATALWDILIEAGARPVGFDALEILRIEAGIGRYGRDMDETNVVNESNLDDAVSYTKGCYVGQEIVIRIKHRGHVAKKLTGLTLEKETAVEAGTTIQSLEGKEIGRITSVSFSPTLGRSVALAYVRYEYLDPGTAVKAVSKDRQIDAKVSDLPFIRGSWYLN